MLLFKKKFHEAIRSGRKRQTIRLWKRCFMRPGQMTYIPGLGRARILQVDRITLEQITEQDAVLDGFASRDQLLGELRTLYGDRLAAGYGLYKIRFQWPVDGQGQAGGGGSSADLG
jgi:hypothetical protein